MKEWLQTIIDRLGERAALRARSVAGAREWACLPLACCFCDVHCAFWLQQGVDCSQRVECAAVSVAVLRERARRALLPRARDVLDAADAHGRQGTVSRRRRHPRPVSASCPVRNTHTPRARTDFRTCSRSSASTATRQMSNTSFWAVSAGHRSEARRHARTPLQTTLIAARSRLRSSRCCSPTRFMRIGASVAACEERDDASSHAHK